MSESSYINDKLKRDNCRVCFFSSIICPITAVIFAIIGGCLVGFSGCNSTFCTNNPQFIAGFVMLMLMGMTMFTWLIAGMITICCEGDVFSQGYGGWSSLICVYVMIVCAIIGGTLIGVSGCNVDYTNTFCTGNGLFVAGFSVLMVMAFASFIWIVIGCSLLCTAGSTW